MKSIFLTTILAITAIASNAQALLDAPLPKSTTIVILLDSVAPTDAYRMAAQVVMDAGHQWSNQTPRC